MPMPNRTPNCSNSTRLSKTHPTLLSSSPPSFEVGYLHNLRQITCERISWHKSGARAVSKVAYNAGHSAALDLTALGLNVNFMPIIDVLPNPNNPGLPDRTFGSDPLLVTNM